MRCFMHFDHCAGGFTVTFLAENLRTPIGKRLNVRTLETLIAIARKLGGCELEIGQMETDKDRWGRGSVWINPSPEQCRFLGIK